MIYIINFGNVEVRYYMDDINDEIQFLEDIALYNRLNIKYNRGVEIWQ